MKTKSESSHVQRIVGHNNQKSMLACIVQNATKCSRTSWHFLAYCSYVMGCTEVWVLECSMAKKVGEHLFNTVQCFVL